MINNIRRITNTTRTVPDSTSISGTILVNNERPTTVIYTGTVDLSDYITDGNSGGGMGYVYLVCPASDVKIARVTGAVQLTSTTWAIQTDSVMTAAINQPFSLITSPMYGYSISNDGGANATLDGVALEDGETISKTNPNYADGYNIGETKKPIYVVATGTDVLIEETLGAPSLS